MNRSCKILIVCLVVSVGLNLAAAGFMIGKMYNFRHGRHMFAPKIMKVEAEKLRGLHKGLRAKFATDPFDYDGAKKDFAEILKLTTEIQKSMQNDILEKAKTLDKDGRMMLLPQRKMHGGMGGQDMSGASEFRRKGPGMPGQGRPMMRQGQEHHPCMGPLESKMRPGAMPPCPFMDGPQDDRLPPPPVMAPSAPSAPAPVKKVNPDKSRPKSSGMEKSGNNTK